MKMFPVGILVTASFALVACETMNQEISTGSFNPLASPSITPVASTPKSNSQLEPGTFVTANIPNTAFYKSKPKGDEDADKLLDKGTSMKIISMDSDHAKVELDSGEVGWIPSVMALSANDVPDSVPTDVTYQPYPSLPDTGPIEPLPFFDPSGAPPEGAIPAIINPDAPILPPVDPITIDPIPDLKPATPELNPDATPESDPTPADTSEQDKEVEEDEKVEGASEGASFEE